jgi:basic membrane lipoprotein Med (substrate-binding protein (PBP1-ABC) superfamily)
MQKFEDDGRISYEWVDNLGYAGDMERVLREIAEEQKPDAIFGDGYGNEEAIRRVAADYPDIAFIFASALGPVEPNVSVFADVLYEPSYLLGLIAGGMTESNTIGVVASLPVPEENKIINAYAAGAKEVNPDTEVLVTFINSWFDPAAAKEAALAQIDSGADVLFAERFGVIEAAVENDVWAFGHQGDQHELGPDHVLSSTVWDFSPCVEYVLDQVKAGVYTSQDLSQFSTMRKGGAQLAPYHGNDEYIPQEILDLVEQRQAEIMESIYQAPADVSTPAGAQ